MIMHKICLISAGIGRESQIRINKISVVEGKVRCYG